MALSCYGSSGRGKKKSQEEEGRSGFHLRDPAHAHVNNKQQLRDGSAPGHLLSPCLVAVFSSLSMNEVTEGELENLCSEGGRDSVSKAALKSASGLILCVGAYCERVYQQWKCG